MPMRANACQCIINYIGGHMGTMAHERKTRSGLVGWAWEFSEMGLCFGASN